ncbi:MAG: DUF4854 domain-containing protein [Butyrivibrio sp.]|nr:DUF4854 domain-containing protein [Acetatifactor muris]MCM1558109.1 DUF4854 domain-containing protein [Butyrivibrio sp.]MCM1560472.1 DUF4854 domain-containing protein [Butyrivibrio sp.]
MKKRIMVLFTAIIMVFAMAACGGKATLESVLSSAEWKEEEKGWNEEFDGTGITISSEADGNTLVFVWQLPDDDLYGSLDAAACETMSDIFLSSLEQVDFLKAFKAEYKVTLDAVRNVFLKADGTEIFRDELTD